MTSSRTVSACRRSPGTVRRAGVAGLAMLLFAMAGCDVAASTSQAAPAGHGSGAQGATIAVTGPDAPTTPPAAVCDHQQPGPATPPAGAITVDPAVDLDLATKTKDNPPGTTFWLAPGVHTLGSDKYGQVSPKDRDVYLGAPGAILDGRGVNQYAFVFTSRDVTISHLLVRGFVSPVDQGVVNHDSGPGWIITDNTIEHNHGAALMAGQGQQILRNCLRDNGQYGLDAFGGDLLIEGNEFVGNNTDDLEHTIPGGCGCTGGMKFWDVNKADIRDNWIHDNHGVGLWADTDDNDFLIEGNLIENNDAEAFVYEISYNVVFRKNTLRNNTLVTGRDFVGRGSNFPVGTIYISESGGEPRVPARTGKIEIYGNVLQDNWGGITLWENADRFCNSPDNTSSAYCTRLVASTTTCAPPRIGSQPLLSDCRWKTQRVDIHDNNFRYDPAVVGCAKGQAGLMAVMANYGTDPAWSPYHGRTVQDAITFDQQNTWHDNTYVGPWTFNGYEAGRLLDSTAWRKSPYSQDAGSTFGGATTC